MAPGRLALVFAVLLTLSAASPGLAGGEETAPPPADPQLFSFVNADCDNYGTADRCAFAVVYTSDSYAQNSVVVVDAYATYRCWVYSC